MVLPVTSGTRRSWSSRSCCGTSSAGLRAAVFDHVASCVLVCVLYHAQLRIRGQSCIRLRVSFHVQAHNLGLVREDVCDHVSVDVHGVKVARGHPCAVACHEAGGSELIQVLDHRVAHIDVPEAGLDVVLGGKGEQVAVQGSVRAGLAAHDYERKGPPPRRPVYLLSQLLGYLSHTVDVPVYNHNRAQAADAADKRATRLLVGQVWHGVRIVALVRGRLLNRVLFEVLA